MGLTPYQKVISASFEEPLRNQLLCILDRSPEMTPAVFEELLHLMFEDIGKNKKRIWCPNCEDYIS